MQESSGTVTVKLNRDPVYHRADDNQMKIVVYGDVDGESATFIDFLAMNQGLWPYIALREGDRATITYSTPIFPIDGDLDALAIDDISLVV